MPAHYDAAAKRKFMQWQWANFLKFCVHKTCRSAVTEACKLFVYMHNKKERVTDPDLKKVLTDKNKCKKDFAVALGLKTAKDVNSPSTRQAGISVAMDVAVLIKVAKDIMKCPDFD